MSHTVVEVTDASFEETVIESKIPVLVDFWAPWCGPCQMIGPFLEKVAEEYAGDVLICKMNVDENKEIPTGMAVRSIPYLVVFCEGEMVDTLVGAPDPQNLIDMIERSLK